jgi:hypothetical protein
MLPATPRLRAKWTRSATAESCGVAEEI